MPGSGILTRRCGLRGQRAVADRTDRQRQWRSQQRQGAAVPPPPRRRTGAHGAQNRVSTVKSKLRVRS
jgi:hypothetical protein